MPRFPAALQRGLGRVLNTLRLARLNSLLRLWRKGNHGLSWGMGVGFKTLHFIRRSNRPKTTTSGENSSAILKMRNKWVCQRYNYPNLNRRAVGFPVKGIGVYSPHKNRGENMVEAKRCFIHRWNPNKTIDSICCDCCLTVCNEPSLARAEESEKKHECPGGVINRFKGGLGQPVAGWVG
jgi:hypothetical protein